MSTTQQVSESNKNVPNPTGKGGFGDNPQNRNPGGWNPETTISYQYRRFMAMNPDDITKAIEKDKADGTWTVAKDLAYRRVKAAQNSLPDVKEITDRTEGKALQTIEQNISGELKTGEYNPELAQDFVEYLKNKTIDK